MQPEQNPRIDKDLDSRKLGVTLRKQMVGALSEFEMLRSGDRVLVAVSGGKDSTAMALLLDEVRRRSPYSFSMDCVILDQGQPGFSVNAYKQWLEGRGLALKVLTEDTYSIVKEKTAAGKTYCSLCSRLRRGILYSYAIAGGYTKIALGHHRDDGNETLLLNMFFTGVMAGMPAKLIADDQQNIVIRPLIRCRESQIAQWVKSLAPPLIPCSLCGAQSGLKRQRIKKLLRELETEIPDLAASLACAQANVRLTQLLGPPPAEPAPLAP